MADKEEKQVSGIKQSPLEDNIGSTPWKSLETGLPESNLDQGQGSWRRYTLAPGVTSLGSPWGDEIPATSGSPHRCWLFEGKTKHEHGRGVHGWSTDLICHNPLPQAKKNHSILIVLLPK